MHMTEHEFLAQHVDRAGYSVVDGRPVCLNYDPEHGTVLETVTFTDCDDIDREFYLDTIGG